MTITTTIPDESVPAWQLRVDLYNAGSGEAPVTIAEFAQIMRDEETSKYIAAEIDSARAAMAANEELMRVGLKAMDATPEKRAAMIAAADAALASAPSRK